jgi:hypothetical protein
MRKLRLAMKTAAKIMPVAIIAIGEEKINPIRRANVLFLALKP